MKTFCVYFLLILFSTCIHAQYCCMKEGAVLIYETIDKKNNRVLIDSVIVEKVVHKDDTTFVTKAWYGDSYSPSEIRAKTNIDEYEYCHKDKKTDRVIMDSKKENEESYKFIASGYKNGKKEDIEKEWKEYSRRIYAVGRVYVPLPDSIPLHLSMPESHYMYKASIYKFKASVKGEYSGVEVLQTEAGRFECTKLSMEVRKRAWWMSSKDKIVEWYAKGIGLVKSETYNKRGKLQEVTTLKAVRGFTIGEEDAVRF